PKRPKTKVCLMIPDAWNELLARALDEREQSGLRRHICSLKILDSTHLQYEGRRYVNFASNDYLGLTHHPRIIAAVRDAVAVHGVGAGAAGLISGHTVVHQQCEQTIARWKGVQA